jgi:Winged helix DNA-binding domain
LAERIAVAGVRTEGQALVHLLGLASHRGLAVRGPMIAGHQAYALVRDWLGEQPRVDRDVALAELARRYLLGHGPADDRDLGRWSGLPLRDVRAGLRAIAPELTERKDGLLDLAARPSPAALPPPRLLGAFDPLLLGWCSREAILGSNRSIVTVNGIFRPFALVDGRAVATWSMPGGEVMLEPFAGLTPADAEALAADSRDVVRYLAGE